MISQVGSPKSIVAQNTALQTLINLPLPEAIGAACSFLLFCATNHATELRRVMNEKVIREGFRGVSLFELIKQVCK